LRLEASLVVNDVLSDDSVRVIPQTRRSFLAGFALYQSRPDKGYSLTDCISMQTLRHSGLTGVLTKNKHFDQARSPHSPTFHLFANNPVASRKSTSTTNNPSLPYS
jgi:predicted nucleic acid-binding protein